MERRSYRAWEEGKATDFVLVLSPSAWTRDRDAKRRTYRHLWVREYFPFEPKRTSSRGAIV